MKIQEQASVGVTGIAIELSMQDILVLANLRDQLRDMSGKLHTGNQNGLVTNAVNFLDKITAKTKSLDASACEMFNEIEDKSKTY